MPDQTRRSFLQKLAALTGAGTLALAVPKAAPGQPACKGEILEDYPETRKVLEPPTREPGLIQRGIEGIIVWCSDFQEHVHYEFKFGEQPITQYFYVVSCDVRPRLHSVSSIDCIYADDQVIYKEGVFAPGIKAIIHLGEKALVKFLELPLSEYGNRLPRFGFEVNGCFISIIRV